MTNHPLLVIAAGGTGGHMFPAQALAEEMLARGWRVKLSTDARGARFADGFPANVTREIVAAASFSQGGIMARLAAPFQIMAGILSAVISMRADSPACVAGFGGYPAFPAIAAASALKLPRIIHEQNGVLGRVNRIFATRVMKVACGTWPTELPADARAVHTGNPVRTSVLQHAGAPYLPPDGPVVDLLVIGGSQGAHIFSAIVPEALFRMDPDLRGRLRVSQQAREDDVESVRKVYANLGVPADVQTFFDDVPERLARAQLVISRAGASSVADIAVVGRPVVLIPYAAAADDHQNANARGLAQAGGAFVLEEAELSADRLAGTISAILSDAEGATAMAAASLGLGRPDATGALADLVVEVSGTGQKT